MPRMKWSAFFLLFVVACTSHPTSVLPKASSLELFTLDPIPDLALQPKLSFHGFRILDRQSVSPTEYGPRLDALLQKGLDENTGYLAACFNPRHGIRAVVGSETYDFMVSFTCNQIRLVSDSKDQAYLTSG